MKTKTYRILSKLENGDSRIHVTEATGKGAAAPWARVNGLEVQRVHDALQVRNLRHSG